MLKFKVIQEPSISALPQAGESFTYPMKYWDLEDFPSSLKGVELVIDSYEYDLQARERYIYISAARFPVAYSSEHSKLVEDHVTEAELVHLWWAQKNLTESTRYLIYSNITSNTPKYMWIPKIHSFLPRDTPDYAPFMLSWKKGRDGDKSGLVGTYLFNVQEHLAPSLIKYFVYPPETIVTKTNQPTKEKTMIQQLIEQNKQAATQAAILETGRIANSALNKLVLKRFPNLPDTPFNHLVLANIASTAINQFKPSERMSKVAAAMQVAAFQDLYQHIDVEGLISEFVSSVGDLKVDNE